MNARSDAAISLAGGILGGLAIGTWLAHRYLATTVPADPRSTTPRAVVTSITNLRKERTR